MLRAYDGYEFTQVQGGDAAWLRKKSCHLKCCGLLRSVSQTGAEEEEIKADSDDDCFGLDTSVWQHSRDVLFHHSQTHSQDLGTA